MKLRVPSTLIVLASLFIGQAALAQRVVVLEFDGDRKGKLRTQVETALKKAGVVDLVALKKYKDAAKKKKVSPSRAMTPSGVKTLAKGLQLDAAVEGATGDDFYVRILDPQGNPLWDKHLPMTRGLISADNARRLAKAIAAAAAAGQEGKATEDTTPKETKTVPEEKKPPEEKTPEVSVETDKPVVKEEKKDTVKLPEVSVSEDTEAKTAEERERRQKEEMAEAHTATDATERDSDLEAETRRPKARTGPRLIQLQLLPLVTWRGYCARPGVGSCREYDNLAKDQQPPGVTINFSATFPYGGVLFGLELFPLAPVTDSAINGLGLVGYFGRGFAKAVVRSENEVSGTPSKEVIALDDAYFAGATYRYHFVMGDERKPLVGYAGVRGGFMGRSFEVDPTANSPLPGSHRSYPVVGVDLSVPLVSFLRVEASGSYFLGPRPGVDEIAGFGTDATGFGFGGDFGFAGDIWGPVGYIAKFRYARYQDSYTGTGNRWTAVEKGAAEETYSTALLGLTVSF